MFKTISHYFTLLAVSIGLISMVACSTDPGAGTGTLEVWMHDAPAELEEVNIFVEEVAVNPIGEPEGWRVVGEPQQHFNLLELVNGEFAPLGETELEAGTYNQVRLIVSRDDNYVVVDGEERSLKVPSGEQTGVKVNVNMTISEDEHLVLLLDFDVSKSVRQLGQGQGVADYLLTPVIRATLASETGSVAGTVIPAEARPVIHALVDGNGAEADTVATTFADLESGEFMLVGLAPASYTISVEPRNEGYESTQIFSVPVTADETTDLGEIELESAENGDDDNDNGDNGNS